MSSLIRLLSPRASRRVVIAGCSGLGATLGLGVISSPLLAQDCSRPTEGPVVVRYSEGTVHGFVRLQGDSGTTLATGDLPLGGLTYYAAPHAVAGARWAVVTTRATALTVATFPPIIFALMGSQYFGARPFMIAASLACIAAAVLVVAAFWATPGRGTGTDDGFAP